MNMKLKLCTDRCLIGGFYFDIVHISAHLYIYVYHSIFRKCSMCIFSNILDIVLFLPLKEAYSVYLLNTQTRYFMLSIYTCII